MAESGTEVAPPLLQANAALYLDFDGTLAAHAPHPDGVTVHDSLPALLAGLRAQLAGAVALVTGRPLATLDAIVGPPRYAGAGLHGLEWRLESGNTISSGNPVGASRIVRELRDRFGTDPRLVIEDKGAAVALHYRQAPERAEECIAAMREIVTGPEFELLRGHAVIEARPRGADKGAALRALAANPPFAGRAPVFVGDDVTDEDGFRVALDLGGYRGQGWRGPDGSALPHRRGRGRARLACCEPCRTRSRSGHMTRPASLDLGVTGNCIISALIDREARVVWSCLPRLDGDPVFHALIDDSSAADARGFWSIELGGFERSEQEYVANTAVLITRLFSSNGSAVEVIDFCPRFERLGRMFRPQIARAARSHARRNATHLHQAPAVFRIRVAAAGDDPWQQSHPVREPRSRAAPDDRRSGELRAVRNAVPARDLG